MTGEPNSHRFYWIKLFERLEDEFSRTYLAGLLGVSRATVGVVTRGRRSPSKTMKRCLLDLGWITLEDCGEATRP